MIRIILTTLVMLVFINKIQAQVQITSIEEVTELSEQKMVFIESQDQISIYYAKDDREGKTYLSVRFLNNAFQKRKFNWFITDSDGFVYPGQSVKLESAEEHTIKFVLDFKPGYTFDNYKASLQF